jgi:TolB-like protein/DNA-binding winged helix-turn-helix (wHTH) protein
MNFHVADWYVDIDANRIHCDEQAIKLESKVMSLLIYLAKNQGNVVSREQLEAEVWTDRVISYDALTSCITRLRKVLGDDSRNPHFIETVPKKGYRLIAPVRWGNTTSTPTPTPTPTPNNNLSKNTSISKYSLAIIFIVALLLLLSIAGIVFTASKPTVIDSNAELTNTPSIVVLPFDNLSSTPGQAYFSDGITADISIALAKLSGLQVISPPSVLNENSRDNDAYNSDTEQPARYLLSGSVQRAANKLRVNVMLIDNHSHQHLWAESYDREITDVFDVQDDITAKIVTTLSIKLTEEEKKRVAQRYTNSIEAYDQFLRGQAAYIHHTNTEIILAREHLQQAIQLDPNFARAYSTLALTYVDEYRYQWFNSTEESLFKTLALAKKAISIDERLPQAYWALAYAQLHLHRYQQAIDAIKQALSVKPDYADGYAILALTHIYQSDAEQGIKMIRLAMRLNSNYPAQYLSVLGQGYYYLGEYKNAEDTLRSAIDKNFNLLTAHIMLTASLSKLGMQEEASWSAGQLLTLSPGFTVNDTGRIFPLKDINIQEDVIAQLSMAGIK